MRGLTPIERDVLLFLSGCGQGEREGDAGTPPAEAVLELATVGRAAVHDRDERGDAAYAITPAGREALRIDAWLRERGAA